MSSKVTKYQKMILLELHERQDKWVSEHPNWDRDTYYKGEDITEVLRAAYKRLPFLYKILIWFGFSNYAYAHESQINDKGEDKNG